MNYQDLKNEELIAELVKKDAQIQELESEMTNLANQLADKEISVDTDVAKVKYPNGFWVIDIKGKKTKIYGTCPTFIHAGSKIKTSECAASTVASLFIKGSEVFKEVTE